jgi:hypothetical protein
MRDTSKILQYIIATTKKSDVATKILGGKSHKFIDTLAANDKFERASAVIFTV